MCYSRRQKILFYRSKSVRLAVVVYCFTCFCRAILSITEPSDKLFALRDFVNLFVYIIVNTAYNGANARLLWKAATQIPGCGHGKECGNPDRLHPDHRPQLVQPRVAESLSKGTEVLHPENFSRGLLLLPDLPLHHPQKPLAYPDAERIQQEDEAEVIYIWGLFAKFAIKSVSAQQKFAAFFVETRWRPVTAAQNPRLG